MAEFAASAPEAAVARIRFTYAVKIAAGAVLVTLADRLFFFANQPGAALTVFALALLGALFAVQKPLRHSGPAALAGGGAMLSLLALAEDPSLLALALFWLSASLTVLLPRASGFDDAWRWTLRLTAHGWRSLVAPLGD